MIRESGKPGQSLEEILAERVATEAVRIAEDRIREALSGIALDPDEVFGYLNSREAAKFLALPYTTFRELAPDIPRYAITPRRFGYLRKDLLTYGKERRVGRFSLPQ